MSEFRDFCQRRKMAVDQVLAECRTMYFSMRDEDKRHLKNWLDQVAPFSHSPSFGPGYGRLSVSMTYESVSLDWFSIEDIPVLAIQKAIPYCDKDEPYPPDKLGELGF